MQITPRLLLNAFMSRDVAELRSIRDNAFTLSANANGQGTLIASTVNGSSFTFSAPGLATLTPIQVMSLAQQALDLKANCLTRPVTRTRAWFI